MDNTQFKKDLQFLTSKEAVGRLAGSIGARTVAHFLKDELMAAGFQPLLKDYFQPVVFEGDKLLGEVSLRIKNHKYAHRIDFSEWMNFSSGGKVNAELMSITEAQEVNEDNLNGKIVLIPEKPTDIDVKRTVETAMAYGVKGILIEAGEPQYFSKSLHARQGSIPVFKLRKSISQKLENKRDLWVQMDFPLQKETIQCQNVIGFFNNRKKQTILLSAHYDHVGDDIHGERFPGAIDNGSGVALILQLLRDKDFLKSLNVNVIMAFFTAEEYGIIGSKQFMQSYEGRIDAAINIDTIGTEKVLKKINIGNKEKTHHIVLETENILKSFGIEIGWSQGGTDAVSFQSNGVPTINFSQISVTNDHSPIHVPTDNIQHIHIEPCETVHQILIDLFKKL